MINGKDLIEMGFKPDRWFAGAIDHINKFNLSKEEIRSYIETIEPYFIDPYNEPKDYYVNIKADTEDEKDNLAKIIETMDALMKTPTVVNGSIMPDACPTGEIGQIPVGGIVVTKNTIHPSMHSADICCSLMMSDLGNIDPKLLLDASSKHTHFGVGGRREFSDLPLELIEKIKGNPFLNDEKSLKLAKEHMGTQGDGNHFLFVGTSKNSGRTILITHHGSRGFGAKLYKEGMKKALDFKRTISPKTMDRNAWIPFDTVDGRNYWDALQIVREWTKLNHSVLHDAIANELNFIITERAWNEHNFVFKDGDLFYHAKGATPLDGKFLPDAKDNLRIIPLNMGAPILIVNGKTTNNNIGFAPHGAGRNISRSEHKRRNSEDKIVDIFKKETEGLDIRFHNGGIDISELPSAYKNANVIRDQMKEFDLGEVVDEIIPYGSIMSGVARRTKRKRSVAGN